MLMWIPNCKLWLPREQWKLARGAVEFSRKKPNTLYNVYDLYVYDLNEP